MFDEQPDGDPHGECAAEIHRLQEALRQIGDFAHDKSTGPAVPDALWEVRSMAYDALRADGLTAGPKDDPDEAFRQFQRDRIAEAQRFDAEQRVCLTCATSHYCEKHNPVPAGVLPTSSNTFSQHTPVKKDQS